MPIMRVRDLMTRDVIAARPTDTLARLRDLMYDRDVRHTLPFLVQTWMFLTPVVYTSESLLGGRPTWVHVVYGLNPMTGVVESFRWALLGAAEPSWAVVSASVAMTLALLVSGLYFFRRLERTFADLV